MTQRRIMLVLDLLALAFILIVVGSLVARPASSEGSPQAVIAHVE